MVLWTDLSEALCYIMCANLLFYVQPSFQEGQEGDEIGRNTNA